MTECLMMEEIVLLICRCSLWIEEYEIQSQETHTWLVKAAAASIDEAYMKKKTAQGYANMNCVFITTIPGSLCIVCNCSLYEARPPGFHQHFHTMILRLSKDIVVWRCIAMHQVEVFNQYHEVKYTSIASADETANQSTPVVLFWLVYGNVCSQFISSGFALQFLSWQW